MLRTFLRHKNHRDIGYLILQTSETADGTLFRFEYWNLYGMSVPYRIVPDIQTFLLTADERENWKFVEVEI